MTESTSSSDRKGVGAEEDNDDPRAALEEFREGVFTDELSKGSRANATQWLDFEIVNSEW